MKLIWTCFLHCVTVTNMGRRALIYSLTESYHQAEKKIGHFKYSKISSWPAVVAKCQEFFPEGKKNLWLVTVMHSLCSQERQGYSEAHLLKLAYGCCCCYWRQIWLVRECHSYLAPDDLQGRTGTRNGGRNKMFGQKMDVERGSKDKKHSGLCDKT